MKTSTYLKLISYLMWLKWKAASNARKARKEAKARSRKETSLKEAD